MKKILLFIFIISIFFQTGCMNESTLNEKDIVFEVKKGETFNSVINRLDEKELIRSKTRFKVILKMSKKENDLKFGVYLIKPQTEIKTLIDIFTEGKTYSTRLTIPEGYNIYQIAELIQAKELGTKNRFLQECRNPENLRILGLDTDTTLEGYLYPETYFVPVNYNEQDIVKMMIKQFQKVVTDDVLKQIKKRNLTLHKVLTIASIVEKEAKHDHEKPIIAGVYYNRLRDHIMLQADPTLIYALLVDGIYDGDIRSEHFSYSSPYNTYQRFNLPKGPIANPSLDSILASIYPAEVDYIYFVAKPDGTHHFSKTLKEHNRAVYDYIKKPAKNKK